MDHDRNPLRFVTQEKSCTLFRMPRRSPKTQRYSVSLVHRYPWPHAKPRKPVPRVEFFDDKKTAFEEAVLLATRQEGVAVVNDEVDMETIAQFDAKDKRLLQLRNNPSAANSTSSFGKPYGAGPFGTGEPSYTNGRGHEIWMYRKGQRVRFFDRHGKQVGPEQSNVAPATAWALSSGYYPPGQRNFYVYARSKGEFDRR